LRATDGRVLASAAAAAIALLLAAAPAQAGRGVMLGIGDQRASIFDDPLFRWLGMRTARLVVPWNNATSVHTRVWLDRALANGVEPVVAFGRHWGRRGARQLPPIRRYRAAFRRFRRTHPGVRNFIPWNEPNHHKQPTWQRPKAAARFYNVMRAECRRCTIVAGDVLDAANMTSYVQAYKRALHRRPRVWGIHNYADAYGRTSTATRQMLRITRGDLWLTETGGVVRRPRGRTGVPMRRRLRDAAGATRYVLRLAVSQPRIKRVYLYQWNAVGSASWDSALIGEDGRLRPAFRVAAQFLRRDVTHAPVPPG
jgi:hypothetical protein